MVEFRPEDGGNRPFFEDVGVDSSQPYSYADINKLRDNLDRLNQELRSLKSELESDLTTYAIRVDTEDPKFIEAHNAEWPDSLGTPRSQVSYHYYKSLKARTSTSAAYICKRFEEAARDVVGTPSLDLMILVELMESEAKLVEEFLDRYVDRVDDSSEKRLLELFEDWVQSGLRYAGEIWTHRAQVSSLKLPDSEIERATQEESSKGQAVFKVQLNQANEALEQDIHFLNKNFNEHAEVFYNQYLGPALDFRLNISRKTFPFSRTALTSEILNASQEVDQGLQAAIADQMRRRKLFSTKMSHITSRLVDRDRYRNYINQLSSKGKPVPAIGPRIMVESEEEADEVEYWHQEEEERIAAAVEERVEQNDGALTAAHDALLGRSEADAHPQYLLKKGGTIQGDLNLMPDVRIDGIIPSAHRHTGADGSPQIRGEDIIGETLGPDVVDPNAKPPTPSDLKLIEFRERTVPPGVTNFDALIAWDGDTKYTYEVQIARV